MSFAGSPRTITKSLFPLGTGGDVILRYRPAPSNSVLFPSCLQEAYCAYTIILMALFWCTEALPLAVTAFLPVIMFPMMGIMTASTVSFPIHRRTCSQGWRGLP